MLAVLAASAAGAKADGGVRHEEMDRGGANGIGHLTQRRHIVEYPESAAMRRGNEIGSVDMEVADRGAWKVELERAPVRPIIDGIPEAGLGADVQKAAPNGILADRARVRTGGNAGVDPRPGASVVGRLP